MHFPDVSDAALPWVLLAGTLAGSFVGGGLAYLAARYLGQLSTRAVVALSGLPALVAGYGCATCAAGTGQPHTYAACPENIRQHEKEFTR